MHDVVVVGAGPVGTLVACELAARGLDVALLERRAEASLHSRAIGIHPPSLAVLERLGIADDLLARATRITVGEVRCDGRLLGSLSFAESGAAHPFVASVPQFETETLLRARLEQLRPGALRKGVAVTAVREVRGHVEVATDAGAAPISARYVVAADGARSPLRTGLGVAWLRVGTQRSYLMADAGPSVSPRRREPTVSPRVHGAPWTLEPSVDSRGTNRLDAGDESGAGRAVLYFERGGVVESLPLPGGRRRWVAMTDELWPDATATDFAGLVTARTAVQLRGEVGPVSAFYARQHRAERLVHGRVILVGDAAHELSPIGGQGMNLGWLDAAALAPVLVAAVRTQVGADAGGVPASEALVKWEGERQRSARRAMWQAAFNMAMGAPRRGPALHARNALVRSLVLPPARARLARTFTMRGL